MKKIAIALAGTAALLAGAAHAEGISVGGSVGPTHYRGDAVGGADTDRSDTGYKLYGGYSFTPNFGLELGYANLGRFRSGLGELKGDGVYLDGVGTLPLGNNFSLLGRIGAFNGKVDNSLLGSERSTNLKVGAGVQYDLSQNVALRGEWERYRFKAFGSSSNTDMVSVGVNYRF